MFVLAAGAIHTPKLLLQSRNDHWPDGLANRSGLVGRNLMFHAQQTFALWPSKRLAGTGPRKCLAFTDFYEVDGQRCGSVQSTGFGLGYGEYLVHLYSLFDHSASKQDTDGSAPAAHTSPHNHQEPRPRNYICMPH